MQATKSIFHSISFQFSSDDMFKASTGNALTENTLYRQREKTKRGMDAIILRKRYPNTSDNQPKHTPEDRPGYQTVSYSRAMSVCCVRPLQLERFCFPTQIRSTQINSDQMTLNSD